MKKRQKQPPEKLIITAVILFCRSYKTLMWQQFVQSYRYAAQTVLLPLQKINLKIFQSINNSF